MKRKFLTIPLILITSLCLSGCADANAFEVKSKKDTTYITIPADLNPSSELPKILLDSGFIEASVNDDNSVTYSISDDDYKSFILNAEESIKEHIDTINSDNENTSIIEVKINKDMDTITATINVETYSESDEELNVNALALKVLHYKAYCGDDLSVKIKLIDQSSNDVYDTITIEQ